MKNVRAILLLLLISAMVITALLLPLEELLSGARQAVEARPAFALAVAFAALALGILLMLPASLLLMLAGFLFGLVQGFLVAWAAGALASTAAFLIGRSAARSWVERKIHRRPLFMAIDRAIRRKGILVVLLTRLSGVPYPALNYSLGLTNVSLRDYILGTNIGMILPMLLFVYLGTTMSSIAAIMNGEVHLDGREWLFAGAVFLAVLTVVVLIIRKAGAVLKEELAEASAEGP